MALGDLGIADFQPRRSRTAAKLLTVTPKQDVKKTERLELRISSDVLLLFKEICADSQTDASKALREFIDETVSAGAFKNITARSDLSVQNVRTDMISKTSRGFAAFGITDLRNKEERELWLNNFRSWGVWLDVPEVNKKFYRYNFKNYCAIIVEVGLEYWDSYSIQRGNAHERISYSIIDNEHKAFNSQGDSFTAVIQWLTKHAKEI